jgi:glycosyltransferase involved in cell wall biosynthesis
MSPEKIHVINPGVDMAHFLRLEPLSLRLVDRLNLLTADPLLLLPARITRRKNIEFGIHVIAELTATLPEVKLVITGPPGPHNPKNQVYLENLQSLSHTLGVTDQVAFLYQYGENNEPLHIPDAVMADFFQLADALFFPSLREGFGIPVLEAGLVRLPIFAADIPPVRESAGRWAHLFNPEGDPRKVARQITVHLKENPAYHLKQRVMRKYTWRNLVREQILPLICLATEIPKETKSP